MTGKFLSALFAVAFFCLPAGAATQDVDITVTHPTATGSCPCGANNGPNMCFDQKAVKAGGQVNVTLVCAPANSASIYWGVGKLGTDINSAPVSSATTTVQMTAPNLPIFSPVDAKVYLIGADGSALGDGQHITLLPTVTRALANANPSSLPDPFVPQHTVTVCPSGCTYAHPEDAIVFVQAQRSWDNVLITVEAAEYHTASGADGNYIYFNDSNMPQHVWVKGIIGNSGTDGTVFPHIWGESPSGGNLLSLGTGLEGKEITIDNFDIGPLDGWVSTHISGRLQLRNSYIHDGYFLLITSDNEGSPITEFYNMHFARGYSHDIYKGDDNGAGKLIMKNSVAEQANKGHDVKSRAMYTELTCNKLIINGDHLFRGSELTDCSEGRECHIHNNLYVTANGGGNDWAYNNNFDSIRFGADREFQTLPKNILDVTGNTFVADSGWSHKFLNVYRGMTPSPPYPVSGNTFVYQDANMAIRGNPGMTPLLFTSHNTDVSTAVAISNDFGPDATANELTFDANNHVYKDRASAGFPAALPEFVPVPFNDPSLPPMPAPCTDPIGNVKIPAH